MALPINIEDLLNKRKVESNRIEFKAGGILIKFTILSVLSLRILKIQVAVISSSALRRKTA